MKRDLSDDYKNCLALSLRKAVRVESTVSTQLVLPAGFSTADVFLLTSLFPKLIS